MSGKVIPANKNRTSILPEIRNPQSRYSNSYVPLPGDKSNPFRVSMIDDHIKVQFDTIEPMLAADVMRERTPVQLANKGYYTTTYGSAFNHAKPSYGVASPISNKERFKPPVPTYGTSNGPSRKLPMGPGPVDRAGSRISNNLRPRSRAAPATKTSGPIRADHSAAYRKL